MGEAHSRTCKQQDFCAQRTEREELGKEELHQACKEGQSRSTGAQKVEDAPSGALQALKEEVEREKEAHRSAVAELEKERGAKQALKEAAEQHAEARGGA